MHVHVCGDVRYVIAKSCLCNVNTCAVLCILYIVNRKRNGNNNDDNYDDSNDNG